MFIKSFSLDSPAPNVVYIRLDWDTPIDSTYLMAVGPEGIINLIDLRIIDDGDNSTVPQAEITENLTQVNAGTSSEFLIMPHSSIRPEVENYTKASVIPGKYHILFACKKTNAPDSVAIRALKLFPEGHGNIAAKANSNGTIDLNLNYWSFLPDSTLISIYWNDTTSYNGHIIKHISYGEVAKDGSGSYALNFEPEHLKAGEKFYFYFVIDDGVNIPFYSDMAGPFENFPPIFGKLNVNENVEHPAQGFNVFLDHSGNGFYDTKSTGTLEPSFITDANGSFAFHKLEPGLYKVDIVIPPGYALSSDSPNPVPVTVRYNGSPMELIFTLNKEE